MLSPKQNITLLSVGLLLVFVFFTPNYFIMSLCLLALFTFDGLVYFISQGWIKSEPNQWLLIINNGQMKKAGVGLKTFKWPTDTAVTFPSTIQGVDFNANQVTKENFGIEIQGIVFWSVHREGDGPFKCYKYTQGSDANSNVKQVTESIVRNHISNTTLLDVLTKRVEIREQVQTSLKEQLKGWGIWPETVEITEVKICSQNLFKDMQTEFRYIHKQLASNALQESSKILQEEEQKFKLEYQKLLRQKDTELIELKLKQQEERLKYEQDYKEAQNEIQKEKIKQDFEIRKLQEELYQGEPVILENQNQIKIQKLHQNNEAENQKKWQEVEDKMEERNLNIYNVQKTVDAYQIMQDEYTNVKINKYIGPENISNVSAMLPAMNMVQQAAQQN